MTHRACEHRCRTRLLGRDPRLYVCEHCGELTDYAKRPAPPEWVHASYPPGTPRPRPLNPTMSGLRLREGTAVMSEIVFLLWSNKHQMWWRPGSRGYTDDIDQAGRYNQAEAVQRVVASAMCGIKDQVTCMVAAPDNWGTS